MLHRACIHPNRELLDLGQVYKASSQTVRAQMSSGKCAVALTAFLVRLVLAAKSRERQQ